MIGKEVFQVGRANGKTNQQVVIEHVFGAEPGTVFAYDDLAETLHIGTDREFSRQDVQRVVRAANRRLLREHHRILRVVQNVGYVVAHASDHHGLATARNVKGQRQFKWALETLENVRLDELTDQQRQVHTAQQVINSELYQSNQRILRRQAEQAKLIAGLTHRVEQMEGRQAG